MRYVVGALILAGAYWYIYLSRRFWNEGTRTPDQAARERRRALGLDGE